MLFNRLVGNGTEFHQITYRHAEKMGLRSKVRTVCQVQSEDYVQKVYSVEEDLMRESASSLSSNFLSCALMCFNYYLCLLSLYYQLSYSRRVLFLGILR